MKICVVGLGIIGGSICMSLKRAGYCVDGYNRSPYPLEYALNNGVIDNKAQDFCAYDAVFVALPLKPALEFIDKTRFKNGALVSDICGVKSAIERAICSKYRNFNYIGCHPMAGKETSGIESADCALFDRASMIITTNKTTDKRSLGLLERLVKDMGFKEIVECSAEIHDRKIAYTSQLAHIVSNAYVKDGEIENYQGFTGGSFQDMTRIAGVDERVWTELYLSNAQNLSKNIDSLINALAKVKAAINSGDGKKVEEILKEGRLLFEESKKFKQNNDIYIKKLK